MADPREKKYTQVINVPCSKEEKAMAQQLSTETGLTMAHLVRRSLKNLHRMTFTNQPLCATGEACKCANMHVIRQSNQQTDLEMVEAAHKAQESRVTN